MYVYCPEKTPEVNAFPPSNVIQWSKNKVYYSNLICFLADSCFMPLKEGI